MARSRNLPSYDERIIAYGDILGWKDACNDPSRCGELIEVVRVIADRAIELQNTKHMLNQLEPSEVPELRGIEFSFFSDNFAVSAPVPYGQKVFDMVAFVTIQLLLKKFPVRGAVTMGKVYHHGTNIFGPALVEAVEIEQDEACYPRFLCSATLSEYLEKTDYKNKVVLPDQYEDVVAKIACETSFLKTQVMRIVEEELAGLKRNRKLTRKWKYLQAMLPRMCPVPIID